MNEIKKLSLEDVKGIITEQIPDAFKEKKKAVKKTVAKKKTK